MLLEITVLGFYLGILHGRSMYLCIRVCIEPIVAGKTEAGPWTIGRETRARLDRIKRKVGVVIVLLIDAECFEVFEPTPFSPQPSTCYDERIALVSSSCDTAIS